MPQQELELGNREFSSLESFLSYLREGSELKRTSGYFHLVGALSDFESKSDILDSLDNYFEYVDRTGDLVKLFPHNHSEKQFLYLDDDTPVFFTRGRKKDLDNTIFPYLRKERHLSRLFINKKEMEDLRKTVSSSYPDIRLSEFYAKRSHQTDIDARIRPQTKRTLQYVGNDGMKAFQEFKHNYGVLPTFMKFNQGSRFKFSISRKGVFSLNDGGVDEAYDLIQQTMSRLKIVKRAISTSNYRIEENRFSAGNKSVKMSVPWELKLSKTLTEAHAEIFREHIEQDRGLQLSSFERDTNPVFLKAKLLDDKNYRSITVRSNRDDRLRVYPYDKKDLDQSFRIWDFVQDHIDSSVEAVSLQ